jgi:hypothetical protein
MTFNLPMFLAMFPQFDSADWKQTVVQAAGLRARLHITAWVEGAPLKDEFREYAQFLMTGHLLVLDKQDDDGNAGDEASSLAGTPYKATIGSVQIESTKQNSFNSDDWNYWLNQTKYGRELLAFMDVHCPGLFFTTRDDSVRDLP